MEFETFLEYLLGNLNESRQDALKTIQSYNTQISQHIIKIIMLVKHTDTDKHINDIYNKFLKRIYLKNPGNKYNLNIEKVFLHKLNLERDINIVFKYKERKVRSKEEVKILIHDIFTNVFNMLESKDFISLSDFKEYLTQFIIEE